MMTLKDFIHNSSNWVITQVYCFLFKDNIQFLYRDKSGKFPDYPDDDEGGSAAIFKEKDPAEVGVLSAWKRF